jgi:hypothetical protein
MSTPNQAVLPDPGTAYNHLFGNAHARVFFTKLAAVYGFPAETPEDQQYLLQLAGRLRHVAQSEKEAADSPYGSALSALDQVMGATGMDQPVQAARHQEQEMAIKAAAAELAEDPMIYNSVLALKANEAAAVAEQLGLPQ